MSEQAGPSTGGDVEERNFRLWRMFHPSHHVTDLAAAEDFFQRVFGRPSTPLASMSRDAPPRPDSRNDYSTFTLIAEVLIDSVDPKLAISGGVQLYPTVDEPHLKNLGWYVDGMAEAFREIQRHDVGLLSQHNEPAVGDEPPLAGGRMPMFFTSTEDAGLRYQFMPKVPFPLDPRVQPDWSLPPVSDDDPLGIECCAHHTILTDRPQRALHFIVDALGGSVVHEGRDEARGTQSTYIHLADSILEYAVADKGTPAHADWTSRAPDDCYHAITWKVVDLDRVAGHLDAQGVEIRTRTEDTIVTQPASSLGVPWGFTTSLTPGDPRPGT